MRAVVKVEAGPGLALKELDPPRVGPNDVMIRVKRVGICGTDLHIYHWDSWAESRIKPPLVIGHEFSGVVEETGPAVQGFERGERVTAEGHVTCGACFQCRTGLGHICRNVRILGVDMDGAFADLVVVPASNVWRIDPEISLDVAALHDPMGNAFHTVMSCDVRGKRVLVLGCGPIGLFCVGILRAAGASAILASEPSEHRQALARKMGAGLIINPGATSVVETVMAATGGEGVDVALEMSGNPAAVRQALECVRYGGDVALLGLTSKEVSINISRDIIFKGITVRGIVGRKMFETWYQMRAFLLAGLLDPTPVITNRFKMDEIEPAMEAIASGAGKVLFDLEENS